MDLISREAVLDGIDKYIEKAQSTGTKDDFISFEELVVKALPSAFEGMTNGEVMKAVFPNLFIDFCVCDSVFMHSKEGGHLADLVGRLEQDWWDSPYKGVNG